MNGRWLSSLLLLGAACVPAIHVPGPERVVRVERAAREVELCVLFQERAQRPLWTGVRGAGGTWDYAMASVVVKHPRGLTVIDAPFGRGVGAELERAGPAVKLLFGDGSTKRALADAMLEAGLDPAQVRYALLTHSHWDHAGGLVDLPHASVLVSQAELEHDRSLTRYLDHGVMPHHLKAVKERIRGFAFRAPGVEGFSASFDVFGDGAVVAVPMPGHTPGSTAFLVRGPGGTTWLFSGDTSWTLKGVELPAHKTLPFDADLAQVSEQLGVLHAFQALRPDVAVVPAHDGAALSRLPVCGK